MPIHERMEQDVFLVFQDVNHKASKIEATLCNRRVSMDIYRPLDNLPSSIPTSTQNLPSEVSDTKATGKQSVPKLTMGTLEKPTRQGTSGIRCYNCMEYSDKCPKRKALLGEVYVDKDEEPEFCPLEGCTNADEDEIKTWR